jgi:hypothetical protein
VGVLIRDLLWGAYCEALLWEPCVGAFSGTLCGGPSVEVFLWASSVGRFLWGPYTGVLCVGPCVWAFFGALLWKSCVGLFCGGPSVGAFLGDYYGSLPLWGPSVEVLLWRSFYGELL